MRTGTPFTVLVAVLALAAAGAAEWRAREHLRQADWLLARATAHAEGYVQTFDGSHVDAELATLAERRTVLVRVERWEQTRAGAVLAVALLVLVAYAQWFLGRLEACRFDEPGARPAPHEPARAPPLLGASA
jgi:CHASE2 domain-containing sensor protein